MEHVQSNTRPYGPISGALHSYLIELAAQMQALPSEDFEVANRAFKGALAELEKYATITS
jgi:hypothetical protein